MSTKQLERMFYVGAVVVVLFGVIALIQSCKNEEPENVVVYTKTGKPITVAVVPARRAAAPQQKNTRLVWRECDDEPYDSNTHRCVERIAIHNVNSYYGDDTFYDIVYTKNGVTMVLSR